MWYSELHKIYIMHKKSKTCVSTIPGNTARRGTQEINITVCCILFFQAVKEENDRLKDQLKETR